MTIEVHDQNLGVEEGLFADLATIPVAPTNPATPAIGARFYARDTGQSFELRPGATLTDDRIWVEIGPNTSGELMVATGTHVLLKEWVRLGIGGAEAPTPMPRYAEPSAFTAIQVDKPGSILSTAVNLSAPLGIGESVTVQWQLNGVPVAGTAVTVLAGQSSARLDIAQGAKPFVAGDLLEMLLSFPAIAGFPNVNAGGIITQ